MDKKASSYDWAAYYRAAYRNESKENNILAEKLADTEAQEAELTARINRIQNNVFWRVSVPIRKYYHALFKGRSASEKEGKEEINEAPKKENAVALNEKAMKWMHAYEQETYRQKHPYLQMTDKINNNSYDEKCDKCGISVDGWTRIDIENTDLVILICGTGFVDNSIREKVKSWFDERKCCFFAYSDEDYYWEDPQNRMHPWFKPDWSPDTLLSFCYIGHLLVVRSTFAGALLEHIPQENTDYKAFYDLCLRLEEKADELEQKDNVCRIGHIEEILFHNRYDPDEAGKVAMEQTKAMGGDVLEAVEKLLQEELEHGKDMNGANASFCTVREDALKRRGIKAHLETGPVPDIYHIVYDLQTKPEATSADCSYKTPFVSVIIPSKDHPAVLEQCLSSFCEKTEFETGQYEFIVVDNGSNPENKKHMEELQKQYDFQYLYQPMEFNFSKMCNLGVAHAKGDYILLLNDDIEIIEKDWLRIMTGQAMQPHVGAVGAKLWYAGSENIQHAGITNLDIGPSHKLITFPDDRNYYYGHNQVTYDMIGVTAACLMVKRSKYEEVGGLDESMKVAYNDVDFCFKLLEAGYLNVLRNDAVLYHHESLSRGLDEEDEGKWERLLQEKEKLYKRHPQMENKDVFYHKNLIDNASNYTCNFKFDYENKLKTTKFCVENAGQLAEMHQGVLQLTVDRAEKQHKIHREEPDIMYLMGWSYVPGADNARFQRSIVLQRENDTFYKVEPFPWFRKDVEAILPEENNISLAGFVVRIKKENLQNGIWHIGMMAIDLATGEQLLAWSDKVMEV
ncbi:MAG: glycosyltransferase family 2 protein [Lachnospiraceae bacterium]|nr:glycosyltransferase family 2 protein [Lachnospiraceae bacterium]